MTGFLQQNASHPQSKDFFDRKPLIAKYFHKYIFIAGAPFK